MIKVKSGEDSITFDMDLRHGVVEITIGTENIVIGYWELMEAVQLLIPGEGEVEHNITIDEPVHLYLNGGSK